MFNTHLQDLPIILTTGILVLAISICFHIAVIIIAVIAINSSKIGIVFNRSDIYVV